MNRAKLNSKPCHS